MKFAYNQDQIYLFPLCVYKFKILDINIQSLIEFTYRLKSEYKNENRSNIGGWQSPNILKDFELNNDESNLESIENLLSVIKIGIDVIGQKWGFNNNLQPAVSSLWININLPGSYNEIHHHNNTGYSGVFYIKKSSNNDDGNIVFDDTRKEAVCWKVPNTIDGWSNDELHHKESIPTTTGDMLIFPSYVSHKVEINASNDDRISASFNFNWHKQ